MIQLTRTGTVCSESDDRLNDLRSLFERQHVVRLPQLLEPSLLRFAQQQLEVAPFDEKHDLTSDTKQPFAFELKQTRGRAMSLLWFLVNDPRFFHVIRQITGCGPIGCFKGRIYRLIPERGHFDSWHDDVCYHRMVGISINLSREIYSGGQLQLCDTRSDQTLDIANTGFGDAILFRIADYLVHQVSAVTGPNAKTALAGWFCGQPDYLDLLHQRSYQT